jgi:DNA-binding response OmpR family regulator
MVNHTILIVDDEELLCVTVAGILRDEGYNVKVMYDGLEVEKLVKLEKIDLVLLDLMMPGMNGLEVLEVVKKVSPPTRVIMLTAFGNEEYVKKSTELGADGFVNKPFGVETLLKHIRSVLSNPSRPTFLQPPVQE